LSIFPWVLLIEKAGTVMHATPGVHAAAPGGNTANSGSGGGGADRMMNVCVELVDYTTTFVGDFKKLVQAEAKQMHDLDIINLQVFTTTDKANALTPLAEFGVDPLVGANLQLYVIYDRRPHAALPDELGCPSPSPASPRKCGPCL
jgi:hypothetical protein